jgi:hypothetical protein
LYSPSHDYTYTNNVHEENFQFWLAKSSAIFSKYSANLKYSANFIDYLGFLIGLRYETITKIANKIQKFPAEIIQKTNI